MAMNTMSTLAKKLAGVGSDSRFFTTTKKGETHELRQELNHQSRDKKKSAVKKVIANMTVGKDVSMLFTDVVNCIQTADTQLKKLVYLYLINYAKSNPDLTILAVNTFVKDAGDPNPLIRALSVRTMGCIRVDRIIEYLCEPLRRCLSDDDPYVRKTAAICVAKLYDINPELVEEQGFVEMVVDLISDANPTVVANAVAALSEISESGNITALSITKSMLSKLLVALNECTEWGQVFILDALITYVPADGREAEGIIERVSPRLQHANSAVVLSAIKIILIFLEYIDDKDTSKALAKKLAPPLITLLSTEPEIQYVALRNINLIVQKRPTILSHEIKVFFCKYNDPIYVKMEKLEIIIRLVSDRNIEQVLLEFKEYTTEVDVDFVRRSVRAIGQCALKLAKATPRCLEVLLELMKPGVSYIVQEAIVVIKDIFRKYPNTYEASIATLCEHLDVLDEPEAKASLIWILGEYAERIDNATELLTSFLETFDEDVVAVQLQLLTAIVKLFLKKPSDATELVQQVLQACTEGSDNPDVRDRGYVYWRLLSADPEAAKAVVLATKPTIKDDTTRLDPNVLSQLLRQIGSLASVYHTLPIVSASSSAASSLSSLPFRRRSSKLASSYGLDAVSPESSSHTSSKKGVTSASAVLTSPAAEVDLLDLGLMDFDGPPPAATTVAVPTSPIPMSVDDFFNTPDPMVTPSSSSSSTTPSASPSMPMLPLVAGAANEGIAITGALSRHANHHLVLDLAFHHAGVTPVSHFAIQCNKNAFGLTVDPSSSLVFSPPLQPHASITQRLSLCRRKTQVNVSDTSQELHVALKNTTSGKVSYFKLPCPLTVLLSTSLSTAAMDPPRFIAQWKALPSETTVALSLASSYWDTTVRATRLTSTAGGLHLVATRHLEAGQRVVSYYMAVLDASCITTTSSEAEAQAVTVLMELTVVTAPSTSTSSRAAPTETKLCLKSTQGFESTMAQHITRLLE